MADAWIKMRVGLRRHPKVVRIVSALKADRLRVVGALHAVWAVFDEHSIDGLLPGYSFDMMDEEIGWPGFSQAMNGIGWLERDAECGLIMPEFQTHNGASAKRRAEDAKRKSESRESVRESSEKPKTKAGPDKRKRRFSSSLRSEEKGLPLPATFEISEAVRKWAAKNGHAQYLQAHFEYFVDYVQSGDRATGKPILAKDWDAKFRNAITGDWGDVRRTIQREQFRPGHKPPNGAARPGEPWYITWTGIQNEGLRRGIAHDPSESDALYTEKVFLAAGVTRDQAARDRREWRGQ